MPFFYHDLEGSRPSLCVKEGAAFELFQLLAENYKFARISVALDGKFFEPSFDEAKKLFRENNVVRVKITPPEQEQMQLNFRIESWRRQGKNLIAPRVNSICSKIDLECANSCLLYTSPSPRDS